MSAPVSPRLGAALPKRTVVPLIVASALFLQQIDATALATSLPAIGQSMHEPPIGVHLALTAYMFSLAAFVPISGWVADRFGARTVFQLAMAIFTLSSLACGLAQNLPMLVAARVCQGLGGALMVPVGRLILVRSVKKSELIAATALMGVPVQVGPILGPLIGGFITTYASWRWIFWVNLPIGIIGILLTALFIEDVREKVRRRFDPLGILLLSVGLSLLLFGLDAAATESMPELVALAAALGGAVCLVLYGLHARRRAEPVIDLSLLKIRSFSASLVGGSLFRVGVGSLNFLLPLLFQTQFAYTPAQSGGMTFVTAVGAFGMRAASTSLLKRISFRQALIWTSLIGGGVITTYSLFQPAVATPIILAVLFFSGVFRALALVIINSLTYADISNEHASQATTMATMTQRLSQSAGIAIGASVLSLLGGGALTMDGFRLSFLIVGLIAASSVIVFGRLAPEVGSSLTGDNEEESKS